MSTYDIDNDNDDMQEAHNDLAFSIANRELLLTAAAMQHTNNKNNNDSDDIRLLRDEIIMLRDEMRERFDVLEKKFTINCEDNSVNVSMDGKLVYKDEGDNLEEEEEEVKLVRLLEEDTAGEEVHDKHQEESLIIPKRGKRNNKPKKQQAKGKRRQKKKNNSPPSSPSPSIIPTEYGILTILVTLINTISTLLLMRGGKRVYMLIAFIAASYLIGDEMNGFSSIPSEESAGNDISRSSGDWFSIGSSFSFSFIRGVRALEDCPDQYSANNIDSYDIGSKVTIEEKVYECTESPCGWKIIGTCVGDMFLSSSASAQPNIQTSGMPVHFPSALGVGGSESNLFEIDSFVETEDNDSTTNLPMSSGGRLRTHSPMTLGTHSPATASPFDDNDASPQTNPPSTLDDDPTSSTATSYCIAINIVYDDYPEETSWKLYKVYTAGDTEIESHTALEGDASYTKSICLENGEYNFIISDSYSDGISSPGHYTVTLNNNGAVIAKGGKFEESESTLFSIPFIPYPSMSPSSSLYPTTTTRSPTISPKPTISSVPTVGPQCEGSNPDVCGCASVDQADYRGTISTTSSGKECIRWDETEYYKPENYPDAGLEDNNFCRNPFPNGDAGCYTTDGFEYCDVPICEDSLPSAYPSSSFRPTTTTSPSTSPTSSARPTSSTFPSTSLSPTQEPKCEGGNPNVCGCASAGQAEYRGTINTTSSGKACIRWDETWLYNPENFPDAGLEDNNYCRNPTGCLPTGCTGSVYCATIDGDFEDCDVPYCFPPISSCPSTLDVNTNTSEELQASCAVVQCIVGGDSNSNDSHALTRSEVKPDCSCLFEQWDCQFGTKACEADPVRQNANECCISKLDDLSTSEASCDCSIKLDCEAGDSAKCKDFAEYCCDENDQQCKCEYQTKACRLSLESESDPIANRKYCGGGFVNDDYYGGAVEACCGDYLDNPSVGLCPCDFWMPLCTDFPLPTLTASLSTSITGASGNTTISKSSTCVDASSSCCGDSAHDEDNKHCNCDFFTYAVETLGYKDNIGYDTAESHCAAASNIAPNDREVELQSLQTIYIESGGDYWFNNTGWITEQDQCNWFGITCDEQGYVIEINLPNSNITGELPSVSLSSFYNLQRLDLRNNLLHGIMAGTYDLNAGYDDDYTPEKWSTHASLFFNLRDLAHVDLSQNNLSGDVDVLFAPALQYVNFSHNNFTSINSFKKFKKSHLTLAICDVSHNSINTSASNLMKNLPTNIEQFILSSNHIHGSLPATLELMANLRRFNMSMNSLSGELPDFSSVFPNLQVFDLSEQISEGLVGNIPESLANLPFLSTLNLGSNLLSGSIPPVLGNMEQLRVLNLSNNKLSQTTPKELGKLGEFAHIICIFCRVNY